MGRATRRSGAVRPAEKTSDATNRPTPKLLELHLLSARPPPHTNHLALSVKQRKGVSGEICRVTAPFEDGETKMRRCLARLIPTAPNPYRPRGGATVDRHGEEDQIA